MPLIDLKNVTVYFEDGSTLTGAVNHAGGYTAGATSIAVDGFTGQVPALSRLKLGTDDRYQVVSTTESGGNTVNIVFTPALATGETLADNDAITVFGRFIQIKVGEGTITWTENLPREYKLDRGRLDQVRNADQVPMDVNFTLAYTELTASDPNTDPPTPEDVLKRVGAAADWVSVNTADPCAPYCINIRLDHAPPNCPDFLSERVVLPQYYYEKLDHSPKDATITTSGKCNALSAIITRYTPQL